VHELEIVDLESEVRAGRVILRGPWIQREVEITSDAPRVFVVTASDPRIARPLVVAGLQGDPHQVSVKVGGALEVRCTYESQVKPAVHASRLPPHQIVDSSHRHLDGFATGRGRVRR
jgi:hypothetical protein